LARQFYAPVVWQVNRPPARVTYLWMMPGRQIS